MIVFSCPHCDEPLPEAAHYCPVCGETLISPEESDSIQSHTSPETDTTQTLPGKDVMTPGEDAIMPTPEQPQATAFKVPYFYDMGIDDGQSAQPVEPDESELTQPVGLSAGLSTALMPVRPAQEKSTPTPSRINATLLPTDAEASDSQQRGVGVASKLPEVRSNWNKVVPPGSAHLTPLPVTPRPKTALKTPPTLPTLKPTQPKALWRVPPPPFWFWVTTIVLLGLLFGGLLGVILTLKAHQPGEITLEVTPSAVPLYGTITLHGSNFQPNTSVGLMRDREFIAIVDSNYKSIISTDRSGSFTDTVFVDAAWGTGSHTIYAEEALTHKVASSTITVTGHVDSSRPPHLTISQTSLNLGIGDQATNSPAIITLGDSGGGVIYWQSTTTQPWLVLSPQQGKVAGDQPMSVTVAGDRSKLSPGAYTGDIIITSTAGKALVAVTMQVIPLIAGHEAVLQVTPAALSFTATDGGANPPTQTITISNPGVQTLQWGTSTSTLNGGNWLTVSPQSGNIAPQGASESVKIGVNTSTLLPGVYRGEVTFSNAGTQQVQDSPQPVFVSLTVQPQCALSVIPGVLTITDAYLQPAPAPTVVNVGTNQGCSKPLNWTASTTTSNGGSWLNIGATSGTAPGSLSVSVNVAGLQPGTYNGQIMLTSTSGSLTLPVTFIMGQPTSPIMGTAPAALSLSGVAGQTTSNSQSINITNSGGGTLSWQATTSGGWLTVAQASGSIASRATASIAVSAALVGLTPGTYTGTITITATGATGSPQSIPVTLTVSPPCTISAAPVALTFAGLVGGPNQAQPATISASGTCNTDVLNWSASVVTSSGGAWLSASPLAGSVSLSATSGTSVGVSLAGLGAGTYTGTVTITAIDSATGKAVGTPQVILITLDMTAPPVLTVSPTSLTFNVTTGTSPQPITIGNSGGEPLNWKAVLTPGGPSFVSLSARSGSNLAGGTTTSTNVIVNATGVTGGQTYFASVTISAIDPSTGKPTQGSGTIVSITINVAAPAMQVTPISLSFNAIQGSNPASQTITITDTGGDGLGWTVGRPSASWLTASPRGGSDKSGASSQVTFSVNTNGLNPGSYSASVTITPSIGSPVTINVALTVNGVTPTPLPTPNVTPGPSPTDTPTPQPSPSPTATPTPQPSPSPTATPTPQPSPSPTATPSPTPSPTDTPTPTPTPTPTDTPTPTPTATASPTDTPTPTVTDTPSPTPAPTPTTTGTATTTATPDVTATTTPDVTPSASPTSTATSNTTGQTTSITLISTGVVPHSGPHVAARVLRSFHPVTSHILPTRATPRPGPHVNTPISWPSRNAAFRDPQ